MHLEHRVTVFPYILYNMRNAIHTFDVMRTRRVFSIRLQFPCGTTSLIYAAELNYRKLQMDFTSALSERY